MLQIWKVCWGENLGKEDRWGEWGEKIYETFDYLDDCNEGNRRGVNKRGLEPIFL